MASLPLPEHAWYCQAWGVTEYMEWRYVIRIQESVTVFRYSYKKKEDIIRLQILLAKIGIINRITNGF